MQAYNSTLENGSMRKAIYKTLRRDTGKTVKTRCYQHAAKLAEGSHTNTAYDRPKIVLQTTIGFLKVTSAS